MRVSEQNPDLAALPEAVRAAVGLVVLCSALVLMVPPFGGPDEADHHTRVQGLASGTLVGDPAEPASRSLTALQRPWVRQTTRAVWVPSARSSAPAGCVPGSSVVMARCRPGQRGRMEVTPVGTYEALAYLLPATVAGLSETPQGADRWERAASLLPALALLVAAVVLAAGSPVLLSGVLLAAAPGLLLTMASLGGSGLEGASALALATALLVPALVPARRGPAFVLAVVAALVLVLSRSLGPLWIVAVLAACAPLAWPWLRDISRRQHALAGGLVIAAVAAQRVWEGRYGPALPDVGIPPSVESLSAGVKRLPRTLRETVGADGALLWLAPWPIVLVWTGAIGALLGAALRFGTTRVRLHLTAVTLLAAASAPLLFAVVMRYTGYKVQARHVLPLLVLVPLLAGAHLARTRPALTWPARLALLAGAVDGALILALAHHYADGGYTPPFGWTSIGGLAAVGAALVTSVGAGRMPTAGTTETGDAGRLRR